MTRPCSGLRSRTASRAIIVISRPSRFAYRGMRMANHNRLLGRVEGVDGIKTGYTRACPASIWSASVQRGEPPHRRGRARRRIRRRARREDAHLIEQKVSLAAVKRTAPRIAEIADAAPMPRAAPCRRRSLSGAEPPPAPNADLSPNRPQRSRQSCAEMQVAPAARHRSAGARLDRADPAAAREDPFG